MTAAGAALLLAVLSSSALATSPGKEQIKLNAHDEAAARAAMLRRADLGPGGGWTGGLKKKPDLSPGPTCPTYHPKQSDLVLTGAAESDFRNNLIDVDSEVQILQTGHMVRLDWQRSVIAPGAVPCLRRTLSRGVGTSSAKLVSFSRIPFARIATYTAAFRTIVDFHLPGKPTVRTAIDAVLLGKGRNEITLTLVGLVIPQTTVSTLERRLSNIIISRVRG